MQRIKPRYPKLNRSLLLANGLSGGWPFYEGSGSTLHDLSGNRVNGGIVGAPPWIGSPLGSALSLNGSTQYVDLGTSINPVAVTYCAWIIPTALSNAYSAVIDRHATGVIFSSLFVKSSGQLACYFQGVGGTSAYDGTGSHTLSVGKLYFLAVTYSSAAGLVGYVNAEVDGTAGTQGTLDTTTGTLSIGRDVINAGREFAGSVVDVKIYPRALSAAEITQLYYNPFAIYRQRAPFLVGVASGGGTTVIRDSPLYLELLATQTRDGVSALELLATQQSNRPLNVELLGTQFRDVGLPTELLGTQKSDAPIYLENLSAISTDRPAFAENLATQISAASLNLESLSTVISSSLAYLENLLTARADYTVQVESLGLISISVDGTISIELLSSQQTNNPVNSELLTTQVSNTLIDLEALSNVRTDNPAAAESLASVRTDNPIQVENLGLVSVSVDGTIVLESLATVRRSDIVQLENISAVFALLTDGAIQLELLVGTAIPLDLTHSFTRLAPAEKFIRDLRKLLYTALVPYTEGRMPEVGALPNVQPNQKQTVGIDFGNFLPPGVALSGTPTVTLSTAFGTDPAAASRIVSGPFVGTANKNIGGTGLAGTAIIFQVGGCLPGVTYVVDAYCTRTDGDIAEASTRFSCNAPN